MSNTALTNLWNYIQSMSLSDRNKQWLAERLLESTSSAKAKAEKIALDAKIEQARQEIRNGECTTCRSKEELNAFLEAL